MRSSRPREQNNVFLSLDPELRQAVVSYMDLTGIETPKTAVRAMLIEHGGATHMDGAVRAARYQAYIEAQQYMTTRLAEVFAELRRHMGLEEDSNGNQG
jgi:hypothetical protein